MTKAPQVSGYRSGVPTRVSGPSARTAGGNTGAGAGGRSVEFSLAVSCWSCLASAAKAHSWASAACLSNEQAECNSSKTGMKDKKVIQASGLTGRSRRGKVGSRQRETCWIDSRNTENNLAENEFKSGLQTGIGAAGTADWWCGECRAVRAEKHRWQKAARTYAA